MGGGRGDRLVIEGRDYAIDINITINLDGKLGSLTPRPLHFTSTWDYQRVSYHVWRQKGARGFDPCNFQVVMDCSHISTFHIGFGDPSTATPKGIENSNPPESVMK